MSKQNELARSGGGGPSAASLKDLSVRTAVNDSASIDNDMATITSVPVRCPTSGHT